MMNPLQHGWINDKFYNYIVFLPAKDCNFNKDNLKNEAEKELMDNIKLITEIEEGYYRLKKSNKDSYEYEEYGEYCYMPCEKGRGAILYYFAAIEFVKGADNIE